MVNTITETYTKTRKIKILPCVKCGCNDIDIGDCGYSSFNVAWGRCNNCEHSIEISPCGCDITKKQIIKAWNSANDPKRLKAQYEKEIVTLKAKIKKLPKC